MLPEAEAKPQMKGVQLVLFGCKQQKATLPAFRGKRTVLEGLGAVRGARGEDCLSYSREQSAQAVSGPDGDAEAQSVGAHLGGGMNPHHFESLCPWRSSLVGLTWALCPMPGTKVK